MVGGHNGAKAPRLALIRVMWTGPPRGFFVQFRYIL